jgi:hypothetical protein
MRFNIEKIPRKKGFKLVVKAIDDQGKKKSLEIFEHNEMRQAKAYVVDLKNKDPDLVMPQEVSFDLAFKEYKKSIYRSS